MLLDANELDLIKGITRTEAKAVHKDLPKGGAWRTIKGHHVYIVDGKIVAGSIPGVTKAKKMTKATMAEHQAKVDAEGKKKSAKNKGKNSSKASNNAGKTAGSSAKGNGGKKSSKTSGSGKKADKGVAKGNETSTKKKKANQTAKPAQSKGAGKPISGAKKSTSEGGAKAPEKKTVNPQEAHLKELASTSTDGMDMWANAHENPEHMNALKAKLKEMEGSTKEKLDSLHKQYGGGSAVSEYKAMNPKAMDDFKPGKAKYSPADVKLNLAENHHAEASAPFDATVTFRSDMLKEPMDLQRHVMAHEIGHVLSNAYPGLAAHVWDNPQDALGRTNTKKGRFEGVLPVSPEESWAEAFAQYHTDPENLKKHFPKAYDFVDKVLPKLPGYKDYLNAGWKALDKANGKGTSDAHYEVFHGTALPKLENILKEGFKLNGGHSDFGFAAYFKSPAFDKYDHEDHQNWLKEREAKGQPILQGYRDRRGNDTVDIVKFFADRKETAVIRAFIPKEHLLDCTQGRPKELAKLIKKADDAELEGTKMHKVAFVLENMAGVKTKNMNSIEIQEAFDKHKPELEKMWGRPLNPLRVSPYEIYAKKHGIKAIIDKLDVFKEEGWQIGVYDPSIIQIREHGRGITYNNDKKTAELIKALLKAIRAHGGALPYCLLHHEMDAEGLHLHVGVQGEETMEKSISRTEAKSVHKDLPKGGEWRTIRGHHIYIVNGKVVAGSIPGVTKAKKATKAQLSEHQKTIDAEAKKKAPSKGKKTKEVKKDDKKVPKKPTKPATGKKRSSAAKSAPTNDTKTPPATKKQGGTKSKVKAKDIRSDAQKNRELAYDVGDKVGGARKDEFIASFKEKPTAKTLEELEKMSGAIAEKMVTKAHLLPKYDFHEEHARGVDLPTAILKKLMQDRIAPKPEPSNPETRKAYFAAMQKVQRHFGGIKSFENMRDALRELSVMARKVKQGKDAEAAIARYEAHPERWSYFNSDSYKQRITDGKEAAKFMDFDALGEKFNNLLTNYDSLNRSIDTVRKNTTEGWDKYLNPQEKKAAPKKKGDENKKWERAAVAKHLRKGGKETKVKKPEDLMKEFNLRGVEFGNWVNDSSGLYHLKRCAEAFEDLSDIIGVDHKDISLNGRLAIAFGARGKGGALAHYEPDRKVINMTKHGGAGSLAHEWGHAMDNILHQYSNGGQESLGFGSQQQMGDHDPKLKALYDNVMDAITKPAPGEKGGSIQMLLDSEAKQLTRYYPEMRRQVEGGMEPLDVYNHWSSKINSQMDSTIRAVKTSPYYRSDADRDKAVKKYEQKRARELKDIGHYLAAELRRKQNGNKYGGEHYKGHITIPTGKSNYLTTMEMNQPGKMQNGVHYYSAPEEMFARVFESYVEDTMKSKKRMNNYLVHGTSEAEVKAMGAPFPKGKERAHMFKAMKNLLDYVGKKDTLKKALILDLLANGQGDMSEELRKSLGSDTGVAPKRSAFNVANPEECIYIPVNRLKVVYQTEAATNWDKVNENKEKMERGEHLEPVVIGLNYDVHDGHHRYEASKLCGYEHIPCIVKGGNDLDRQRAIDAYREVWKSIEIDPTDPYDYGQNVMFRGIGLRELKNIRSTGVIKSKGKGNDGDKGKVLTCFSNLFTQAEGYARSNYDLYDEKEAFVLVVKRPDWVEEDEHGELVSDRGVPRDMIITIVYVPKPDIL